MTNLMNIFALQVLAVDTWESLVESFLKKADEMGYSCKTVEAMDSMTLGSFPYLRLRSDLDAEGLAKVVTSLHEGGRSVIMPSGQGAYEARLKDGRKGAISLTKMHFVPKGSVRMFRGNAHKHWQRQFQLGFRRVVNCCREGE